MALILDSTWNEYTCVEDSRIFQRMFEGGQHLLEDEGCAGGPGGPVQEQRRRGLQVKPVLRDPDQLKSVIRIRDGLDTDLDPKDPAINFIIS